MFVLEQYRSRGVGSQLVDDFKKWSREKGAQRILVVAYVTNEKAVNFYQRDGFFPESTMLEANI